MDDDDEEDVPVIKEKRPSPISALGRAGMS